MLGVLKADMRFVQNFTPPDFQEFFLHRQFHLISAILVIKAQKNEWKWRNLHHWQKIFTATGSDGMNKFHLYIKVSLLIWKIDEEKNILCGYLACDFFFLIQDQLCVYCLSFKCLCIFLWFSNLSDIWYLEKFRLQRNCYGLYSSLTQFSRICSHLHICLSTQDCLARRNSRT